jgi:hypothetical protein
VAAAQQVVAPQHSSVTYQPRSTNHILHLILTVLTCGAWALVWAVVAAVNSGKRDPVVTHYQ